MSERRRILVLSLVLLMITAILLSYSSCAYRVKATDLMKDINPKEVDKKEIDERFVNSMSRFSIELFKRSIEEKNSLVSPLSVMLALSMTANGADGETLTEMKKVLGDDITIEELNEYLYAYANSLPNKEKSKFEIANSIWFKDLEGFNVEESFLQKNADYYNAAAYKSDFDKQTLKDINNWVKDKTDGMIDKILDAIAPDAVMYLINAIVFDAEWERKYESIDVTTHEFTNIDGSKVNVDMMTSIESYFISDDMARGFIKPYKNGDYSFVAILPNEDITIYDYINSLSGEDFINLVKSAENKGVNAYLPKFSYDYRVVMNDALKDMGMELAFGDAADFSKIAKSSRGNLYIHEVLHKTFITVNEIGTRAGAVTKVEMRLTSGFNGEVVKLDRPFVYAIVDNETSLPIFIGAVVELGV